MEKFTLDEALDIVYNDLLEESLVKDIKDLREEYDTESNCLLEALDILTEFKDGRENERPEDTKSNENDKTKEKQKYEQKSDLAKALDMYDEMNKRAYANALLTTGRGINPNDSTTEYKAEPQFVSLTSVKDLPFPKNIIYFISQLITWIKRNIVNFIDKFLNIVRGLFGLKTGETKYGKDDLKFSMTKAKKIETKYMGVTNNNAYRSISGIEQALDKINNYKPDIKTVSNVRPAQIIDIDASDVNLFEDFVQLSEAPTQAPGSQIRVLSLDTSKDLYALKATLQHFFDLFDNAFGSNDEQLFSTDDLLIVLKLLKSSLNGGLTPVPSMEIGGKLANNAIDSTRIKDNLIRTKINTDNLKKAYVATNQQINLLTQVITNKNLQAVSTLGVQYAYLSSSTYAELIDIVDIIDTRLKETKKMEKNLLKMKESFEKLTKELEKRRVILSSAKSFVASTVESRTLENLYDSARYMAQITQLRLNALALYISELNDTRVIVKNMTFISGGNKNLIKQQLKLDKIKSLF